jgi:hypothetical protein
MYAQLDQFDNVFQTIRIRLKLLGNEGPTFFFARENRNRLEFSHPLLCKVARSAHIVALLHTRL